MLTPEYLATLPNTFVDLWAEVEQDIVSQIARRIIKTNIIGAASSWQIEKLLQMSKLTADVEKDLTRATKKSTVEIKRLLTDAANTGLRFDDSIYKAAGLEVTPLAHSQALRDVLLSGVAQTEGLMTNLTRTTAETSQKAFYNAMDKAWIELMSGAYTPQQAITGAIKEVAAKGMESVAYPTGHVDKLDVAARRAILTGANQTTAKLQIARMDEMNCELVEVTSHAGARPSHAEWQGGIYCRKGKHPKYKDFVETTGYGSGDGLCGWNCYHNFYPFFEGISKPSFSRDPSKEYLNKPNNTMYEQQQEQRAYERAIRASKRECLALDTAIQSATDEAVEKELRDAYTKAAVKLKRKKDALKGFLERVERTRNEEREWVNGYRHSAAQKAVWAARKAAKP